MKFVDLDAQNSRLKGEIDTGIQRFLNSQAFIQGPEVRALETAGVPSNVYYLRPVHLQAAYLDFGGGEGSPPVADQLCQVVLSLPMHPYLFEAEIDQVCLAVSSRP